MRKILFLNLSLSIAVIVLLLLTGCTVHVTKNISDKLNLDELYSTYQVRSVDLSSRSKCKTPPSLKIVNIESRTEEYEALENPPASGVINPKEMMDSVALYLKNGYEQSHIKVDDQSTKILQIKMIELKSIAGVWTFGSYFKIGLNIPETGFAKFYEARDNSGHGYAAAAYAIHKVTRQIIDDPEIQDYILCK